MKPLLLFVTMVVVSGCASVQKERGHQEVAALVKERTGRTTHWENGTPEDQQVAAYVNALLKQGLSSDRAAEIALVNNRSLQGIYEGLDVSQADMVQAGLLSNPRIGGSLGFPVSNGRIEYEASLVQNFLDLFVLPLRKRVAKDQFEAAVLRVAHEALSVTTEVRKAFAAYQSSLETVALQKQATELSSDVAELARLQFKAGNVTDLFLSQEQSAYEQAGLDLGREELELIERREKLNRLLGLMGTQTEWTVAEKLPSLPSEDPPLAHLETMAIQRRLDVDAARKQALLLGNAVEVTKTSRWVGFLDIGVHTHQDPNGPWLFGPTLALELPIFDQRQAMIAKLEAQQRQAQRHLDELSVETLSEVRVARARLLWARQVVGHYQKELAPLSKKVLTQSQRQYNGMQLGPAQLLQAKRDQLSTERARYQVLRDYWIAWAELERAVGGCVKCGVKNGN